MCEVPMSKHVHCSVMHVLSVGRSSPSDLQILMAPVLNGHYASSCRIEHHWLEEVCLSFRRLGSSFLLIKKPVPPLHTGCLCDGNESYYISHVQLLTFSSCLTSSRAYFRLPRHGEKCSHDQRIRLRCVASSKGIRRNLYCPSTQVGGPALTRMGEE